MKKKIILHIGMPKTATSFIQEVLLANREVLGELGLEYPDVGLVYGAHHAWADILADNKAPFGADPIGLEDASASLLAFESGPHDVFILSSEALFSAVQPTSFAKDLAHTYEIKVVAFLRHPLDYLNSMLNQVQKMRLFADWSHIPGPWDWRRHVPRLYTESLDVWRAFVGRENLSILPMSRGVDPWVQFCAATDQRLKSADTSVSSFGRNESLRPDALGFIERYINSGREKSLVERSMLANILADYSRLDNEEGAARFNLLPKETIDFVQSWFREDLRKIEEEYLEDGAALKSFMQGEYVDIRNVSQDRIDRVTEYVIERLAKHAEYLESQLEAVRQK